MSSMSFVALAAEAAAVIQVAGPVIRAVVQAVPAAVRAVALEVAVRVAAERRGSGKWRGRLACASQWRDADGTFGGFTSLLDKLFL